MQTITFKLSTQQNFCQLKYAVNQKAVLNFSTQIYFGDGSLLIQES